MVGARQIAEGGGRSQGLFFLLAGLFAVFVVVLFGLFLYFLHDGGNGAFHMLFRIGGMERFGIRLAQGLLLIFFSGIFRFLRIRHTMVFSSFIKNYATGSYYENVSIYDESW